MLLNRDTFQVEIAGKILPKITKQEFAILELLLRNPKQVFSKEDIFEYAWDEPYIGETKTSGRTYQQHPQEDKNKLHLRNILKQYGESVIVFMYNLYSFFTIYLRLIRIILL